MRVEPKTFYADLFSRSAETSRPAQPALPPPAAEAPAAGALVPAAPATPDRARDPDNGGERPRLRPPPRTAPKALPAPEARDVGQARAAADDPPQPAVDAAPLRRRSPLAKLLGDIDVHAMSPRQMADMSLDLYAAGAIDYEDYAELAFQAELHPQFERTIGALTGEPADPDRPRDYVRLWDERADFQRRHNASRPDLIRQSERIAAALRRIQAPMNVVV